MTDDERDITDEPEVTDDRDLPEEVREGDPHAGDDVTE